MLDKIKFLGKRKQIISFIRDMTDGVGTIKDSKGCEVPKRHHARLYVIGFLSYIGYSSLEIKQILEHYNPKLLHTKYSNLGFIDDVLAYSDNNVEKRKTFTNKYERSESNIPVNIFEVTSFRYGLIPDSDKNKKFFRGANIIAYGYKDKFGVEKYNAYFNNYYNYNPLVKPYYRSIKGDDHVLFVADLDRNNFDGCFDALLSYAKRLYSLWDWDIVKFSGSEGLHLIKYLPKDTSVEDLQRKALEFDPDKKFLDWHLFNDLSWKIRGYCVNWKTGFISYDVNLETFVFPTKQKQQEDLVKC